jgi:hypothetical protein
MELLGKEQLLLRPALPTEDVALPSFGGCVRVRAWLGTDKDDFDQFNRNATDDLHLMRASAVAASCIGVDGNRLFNMNGDVQKIADSWPATDIDLVWEAASRLNSIGKQGLEDAEKN